MRNTHALHGMSSYCHDAVDRVLHRYASISARPAAADSQKNSRQAAQQ
jgi:hypothetical protein